MSFKQKQLMEYATQDLAALVAEHEGLDVIAAMGRVYHSDLYAKLQDPETGLYLEGSDYLYFLFREEDAQKGVYQL